MRYFFSRSRNCGIPLSTGAAGKNTATPRLIAGKGLERVLYIAVLSLVVALCTSAAAWAMLWLLRLVTTIAFAGRFSFDVSRPDKHDLDVWVIAVPVVGALLVMVLERLSLAVTRHTIMSNPLQQSNSGRFMRALRQLPAMIAIGTGSPLGPEGPAMDAGNGFGKWVGGLFTTTAPETMVLCIAGSTAGVAFIFGAPVAAAVLAAEIWMVEFSLLSGVSVVLAALAGATFRQMFWSNTPFFSLPAIAEPEWLHLVFYTIVGVGTGVVAGLITRAQSLVSDLFARLPLKPYWWPVVGATGIGIIGYFEPATFGPGFHQLRTTLNGNITFHLVIVLIVFKFLSWLFAQASGSAGGAMFPLMVMGAALGVTLTALLQLSFRDVHLSVHIAAIIGMAAMFAGTSRAWVAAVILALECTRAPNALLPLALACTASYFTSYVFLKKQGAPVSE
ncbi:chloride channel protein [Chitinophaga horti]|uniref:Chloride channel protein n=1 Tax=Chitinophaga horti TaxID=2920382 RepID=A0ABY6IYW6_9BACT|nr:chloride channel protein [Chitinophaga horti]UYQ92565.1 chloride channel protein [Chitinophaga horti]